MNANVDLTDGAMDRLARLWLRAWMAAGCPNMTAQETIWRYSAITKIPAQMCGITNMKDYKKAESRIAVECCGRERAKRGKTFLVRVALNYTTITHIVAPLAGLTLNVGGTANIDCASGQRGVTMQMLRLMERMHIAIAVHFRSRDALKSMSGPEVQAAFARIEEAEIRGALWSPQAQAPRTPASRL